jgi:hypothetical protein
VSVEDTAFEIWKLLFSLSLQLMGLRAQLLHGISVSRPVIFSRDRQCL